MTVVAFSQFLMIVFSISLSICSIVFLKSSQILLQILIISFLLTHYRAMKLIMMYFSLLFTLSIEYLSIDELSLYYLFDAFLSFRFIPI